MKTQFIITQKDLLKLGIESEKPIYVQYSKEQVKGKKGTYLTTLENSLGLEIDVTGNSFNDLKSKFIDELRNRKEKIKL